MTAPWQKTFRAFAGPGIDHPSDSMRVSDDEAAARLAEFGRLEWSAPVYVGAGRHAGYTIHHARDACITALFDGDGVVGFYAGSYLWLAREHRGIGLSTPLILAAAEQRGGYGSAARRRDAGLLPGRTGCPPDGASPRRHNGHRSRLAGGGRCAPRLSGRQSRWPFRPAPRCQRRTRRLIPATIRRRPAFPAAAARPNRRRRGCAATTAGCADRPG